MNATTKSARSFLLAGVCAAALGAPVLGQSNVDPVRKFAWGENIGFVNFRDANAASQGVVVRYRRLAGFGWGENIGWINFGDGTPGAAPYYANTSGADHGVNVLPSGDCFGYAWGENIGWINFNTAPTLSAFNQQARVDRPNGRLRGYAWGENVGWINLDNTNVFVEFDSLCPGDYNRDGVIDLLDLLAFNADWSAGLGQVVPAGTLGDIDGSGTVDLLDLLDFISSWSALLGTEC